MADVRRVLLVEDDPAHAEIVRRAFSRDGAGYALEVCDSIAAARLRIKSQDLVIADLVLADGRGTDLVERCGAGAAPPVVVLTSQGSEATAVEALKCGAIDYVVKSEQSLREMPRFADRALREYQLIVDRQRAEAELRKSHAELERRVAERTAELQNTVVRLRHEVLQRRSAEKEAREQQQSLQQLVSAHECDRKLIAYEIHDGLVQDLTAALMHLESAQRKQGPLTPEATRDCKVAHQLLREAIAEGRNLISGLRPPVLDDEGIVPAIGYLIASSRTVGGPPASFSHNLTGVRLSPLIEDVLFRIVQESLTNVRRHSQAAQVHIRLCEVDNRIRLEVRDDGVGFDPGKLLESNAGLRGIRERAKAAKGLADIDSRPGCGTTVRVDLPRFDALETAVAECRRAEATLRESEERFRQLAEHIREVFWLTEWPENRVIYVSPAYETAWGRTAQSLYDNSFSWLDTIHPLDRERVRHAYLNGVAQGAYNERYRVIRPDGTVRWIHDRGFPIEDASGFVYRIAGIAEDVTDAVEAAELGRSEQSV